MITVERSGPPGTSIPEVTVTVGPPEDVEMVYVQSNEDGAAVWMAWHCGFVSTFLIRLVFRVRHIEGKARREIGRLWRMLRR